jgi:hypothetical protein
MLGNLSTKRRKGALDLTFSCLVDVQQRSLAVNCSAKMLDVGTAEEYGSTPVEIRLIPFFCPLFFQLMEKYQQSWLPLNSHFWLHKRWIDPTPFKLWASRPESQVCPTFVHTKKTASSK